MANDKATLGLEIEQDTLTNIRLLKKELEDLEKAGEKGWGSRKGALQRGGHLSPAFKKADEEYRATIRQHEAGTSKLLKLQADYERRSQPLLKRAAGWMNRMFYGEKIGSSEEADREHRKMMTRMDGFNRGLHGTLALSSHLASTLAPLPGGGILHAAVAGAASGFSQGALQYDQEKLEAGEKGGAGGRFLAGGLGAAKMAAMSTIVLGLAKAVSGAVIGGRRSEDLRFSLGQEAGGDLAGRDAALGWVRSGVRRDARGNIIGGNPLTEGEAAGVAGGVLRAGGGQGSFDAAMQAHMRGQGSAFTQLLGGLAQGGANRESIDASAKRIWLDVLATGVAQGLQKGRIGELIAGAMQIGGMRSAGVGAADPSGVLQFAAGLGSNRMFAGRRGFETIGRLESFGKGESSPMAHALALMSNGLGAGGKSFVQAEMGAERGFFSGEGGGGAAGLSQRINMLRSMGGGPETTQLLLKNAAGLGWNESAELLKSMDKNNGVLSQGAYAKFQEQAKTDEQKAFSNMAQMNWKSIDKLMQGIEDALGRLIEELGGLKAIMSVLKATLDGINALMGGKKPDYGSAKEFEIASELQPDSAEAKRALARISTESLNKAKRDAYEYARSTLPQKKRWELEAKGPDRASYGTSFIRDPSGAMHVVISLKGSDGADLARVEAKSRERSAPQQVYTPGVAR